MYSQEIADEICRRLSEGETLRQICRDEHMPAHPTVLHWAAGRSGEAPALFANQYARARSIGLDAIAEEIIEIADDSARDTIKGENGEVQHTEWINRSRLRVDARKWLLSKLRPEKYGDRTALEHSGPGGRELRVTVERIGASSKAHPPTPSNGEEDLQGQ